MLTSYQAQSATELQRFINVFMNHAPGWAVEQPDLYQISFPTKFVLVADQRIKLATVHQLNG